MKENEAYAESLEFKQSQLNASFQELANNLINSDLVGLLLSIANGLVQVDNATGNVISRILILTGLGWGGSQLLRVSKLIPVVSSQFSKFKEVIALVSGGAGTLSEAFAAVGNGTSVLSGIFSSSLPIALGVAAAITAIVIAVKAIKSAYDEANRTLSEFNSEISSVNDQLQTNQSRIDEINAMPWNERTADILNEKAALEKENKELERQLDLLDEERKKKAEKETGDKFIFHTGEYQTEEQFVGTATPITVTTEITRSGENAYKVATEQLTAFANQLDKTGQIADKQRAHFDSMNAEIATQVEWLRVLEANGESLTDEQKNMIAAYEELQQAFDRAVNGQELLAEAYNKVAQSTALTESEYQRLISLYPQLASAATQTADGYVIQQSALESLMSAEIRQQAQVAGVVNGLIAEAKQSGYTQKSLLDLVAAQIQASNTGLNFSQQIAALRQLATQAGYASAAVANALNAGKIYQQAFVLVANGKYKTIEEAQASLTNSAWNKLTGVAPDTWSTSFGGGGSYTAPSTSSASSAADSARQAQIKALQNERDQIQDTIDAINDKYDAELKAIEEVNDALDDEIELQKILQEMAEAKASKKMVYKDGRFQYVSDMDAVASAQLKLDEYNRKKALKDQKADIERRRQLELQAYNDRLDIINKNLNALQNGFNSELNAWDDYLEGLQKKIEAEEALKKRQQSGGNYSYTPASSSTISNIAGSTADKVASGVTNAVNKAMDTINSALSKTFGKTTTGSSSNYNKWTNTKSGSIISSVTGTKSYGNGGRASGTQSAPAGITLVGEQGPELRVLNQGDGILPANITRNLWAMATDPQFRNGKMGNTTNTAINVANVTLPNVRNAEDFVAGLKNMAYQRAYARS